MSFGGGGGGSSSIQGSTDVFLSSPDDGQVLSYDAAALKWVNNTISGAPSIVALSRPGALAVATGSARMPLPAGTLVGAYASIGQAANDTVLIDINRNGSSVFASQSDRLTIAAGSHMSAKAALNVAIDEGDYLTVDVDNVGGAAGPSFVARTDASTTSAAINAISRPAGAQAGDVHIAVLSIGVGGTPGQSQPATVVSVPTGWTNIAGPIRQVDNPSGRNRELYLFWWRDDGSQSSWTFTITQPTVNSYPTATVVTYRGCASSGNPIDAQATYATPASYTSWNAPGVTTTAAGACVLSVWAVEQTTNSLVYPTGETVRAPAGAATYAIYLSDFIAPTAGAVSARALGGSSTNSSRDVTATIALLPDAGTSQPGADLTVSVIYRATS